jgi:CysZ protein
VNSSRSIREFFKGARLLGRGFGLFAGTPGLLILGMVPAIITLALISAAFGTLLYFIGDLTAWVTWFADGWETAARTATRVVAGVAIIGIAALVAAMTFVALTLIVGDPFYEIISKRVDERLGNAPVEADIPWYTTIRWNLSDSLRLLALSLSVSVPLFFAGFLPVIGQTLVPVLDVAFGAWLIALEVTGIPFNRRGLRLADRRRLLRANRAFVLGFGVPVFLLLMIPLAGVLVIPAAIAGSTILTRHVLTVAPRAHPVSQGSAGTQSIQQAGVS